jgi:hypothetical protein
MDKALLQELVRHRINERRLPLGRAVGILERLGDGQPCDACQEPISAYEKTIVAMVSLEWMSVCFHADCYELWDAERSAIFNENGRGGQSPTQMRRTSRL